MSAPSSIIKNNTWGSLTLIDGGVPTSLAFDYDLGDVAITGLGPKMNDVQAFEARGRHKGLQYAARRYAQISLSLLVGNVVGDTNVAPGSVAEFISGLGAYAALVSTAGVGRPFCCHGRLKIEGTNFGDVSDEEITARNVHWNFGFAEAADGNKLTLTGTVYGDATGSVTVARPTGQTVTYGEVS